MFSSDVMQLKRWSGRRGSNSQLSAWEFNLAALYFQYLQNRSRKIHVHATHAVHAVPDLPIAAGRLRDDVSHRLALTDTH
jgi:hypothetical protein